jgi:hypothetical protein
MAVAPELRGRGTGRRLLAATIDRAHELGAGSLFLGSSTKLPNAVHLYEALGFRHVPPETLHMPYDRADVFMQLVLEPAELWTDGGELRRRVRVQAAGELPRTWLLEPVVSKRKVATAPHGLDRRSRPQGHVAVRIKVVAVGQ